jgi:hypothetical protein
MRKTLLITSCAAAISAFATVGAFAQSGTTAPTAAQSAQTPSTKPMMNDASKSGSPAAQGAMQNGSTTGMSNDKMSKDKMKKDNMSK